MQNPYFKLIRHVWTYGTKWRPIIVGYYIAYIIAQGVLSMSPYAFGRSIDVLQNFSADRLQEVIYWLVVGVLFLLIFWAFHGPARVIERHIALKIQQNFRIVLYQDMTRLPLKWHQDHHSGNILTRVNRSSTSLYRFAESQFIYIESIVRFLVSIAFLFWISLPVGLVSLVSAFLIMYMIIVFDRKLIPLYDAENEVENRVGAVLFDYINNMTTVLTLRLGELTHSNLFTRIMAIWPFFKKEALINEIKWFLMISLLWIVQTAILIGYIMYTLNTTGTIMIGLVVMIFRYQWDLNSVFNELSIHYGEIVRMETDVKGVQPILDDIKQFSHLPKGASTAQQWHCVDVSHLSFHHSPGEVRGQVFDDIAFSIKRGEKIALIGASGTGKSTLLNLLCGLYTPDSVKLAIDNIEFDSLEPLQAITTLIPQDPEIFENTIAFNITMDLPVEADELDRIIKLSGFSMVLDTLPEGLNTDIREKGLNLSVGQKQRLALARGLFAARYSSLILMDEPTSSLDLPTEKGILTNVMEAFSEAAIMVSLHRLHLLPLFDRVIMFQDGQVVASGSMSKLLRTKGPVYDLWTSYGNEER